MSSPINYEARLQQLLHHLDGSAALILSQPVGNRPLEYTQDSFLKYLINFSYPNAALLVCSHAPRGRQTTLYVEAPNKQSYLFSSYYRTLEDITRAVPVDRVALIDKLWEQLPALLVGASKLYYSFCKHPEADSYLLSVLKKTKKLSRKSGVPFNLPVYDSDVLSAQLRLVKDDREIERMTLASTITAASLKKIFQNLSPGTSEREVRNNVLLEFYSRGAEGEAFPTIVASGTHATTLHYQSLEGTLSESELLMIDAGAKVDGYACDMTRCFPVGKNVPEPQRKIHTLCCDALERGVSACTLGTSLSEIDQIVKDYLHTELRTLGVIKRLYRSFSARNFYPLLTPHVTCHWIGLDVHEVGDSSEPGKETTLKPGMCFTIEPGVYINSDFYFAKRSFRGIGVRIEDTILMTENGPRVLTDGIPRTLEELMPLREAS